MRRLIAVLMAAFLLAACSGTERHPATRKPNVLFLAIDDMNDWAGCLRGHPQARTPNIDRLASRGVLFTNAHCPSPLCTPSRTAIFTGRRTEETRVYSNSDRLDELRPGLPTLPAHFRAHGYRTLTAGKTFPVRGAYRDAAWDIEGPEANAGGPQGGPFTREEYNREGKPESYNVERLDVTRPLSGMYDRRAHNRGGSFDWGPFDLPDNAFGDGIVADWAVEQLGDMGDEPFFLAVGFYRPHQPLYAPKPYFEPFPPEKTQLPETRAGDLDDVPETGRLFSLVAATAGLHSWVTEADQWHEAVAAYLACIHFADAQVGKVLDALEQGGHADDTIVVLSSDHGYHLGEKRHWGKLTGWEESTRVPFVIAVPESMRSSFTGGQEYSAATNLLDIFPTLVELAGLPPVLGLAGRSLVAEVEGERPPEEPVSVTTFSRGNYTVARGHWRYIHYFDGSQELYDLAADPHQFENLAGEDAHQERLQTLRQRLPEMPEVAWTARWRHYKVVEFNDPDQPALLFDLNQADSVTDRLDIAGDHPEIVAKVREFVESKTGDARFVEVPEDAIY